MLHVVVILTESVRSKARYNMISLVEWTDSVRMTTLGRRNKGNEDFLKSPKERHG